jgi:multicomponent Na+:H+ antiporter subunit E
MKEPGILHWLGLVPAWLRLVRTLIVELLKATWATLKAVYSPRGSVCPAILAVPVDEKSPLGITVFANMITLTPGTTTLDVSADNTLLYVHALDAPEPQQAISDMKASLETSVKEVLP